MVVNDPPWRMNDEVKGDKPGGLKPVPRCGFVARRFQQEQFGEE